MEVITRLPVLAARPADSNKGTFGRVLIVAGSRGMSGAAILCGSAALRSGAGLVFVAVPEGIVPIVAAGNSCYLTVPLPQDEHGVLAEAAGPQLLAEVAKATVAALGPGLGHGPGITALVTAVLAQTHKPLVLDADALNALQGHTHCLNHRPAPVILTPHPGEFARLIGSDIATMQARRQALATAFAAEHQLVLVLKGYRTIVTDGQRVYVNSTGNPGMATGGTGDVLTGLIAALLGQGLDPFGAAQLGVYLHGLAGDLARDTVGEVSLIASDLLLYLPRAIRGS
jgi:ADP-dependent NAD(P)H-hydrate dehydratase